MVLEKMFSLEGGVAEDISLSPVEFPEHAHMFYATGRIVLQGMRNPDGTMRGKRGGSGPPGGLDGEPDEDVQDKATPDPQQPWCGSS